MRGAANRDKYNAYMRDRHLQIKYGMTEEEYAELFKAQGEVCAICKRPQFGKNRFPVDHCHKTGKVRGLLCNPCNSGMGRFEDDPQRMREAVRYLEESLVD